MKNCQCPLLMLWDYFHSNISQRSRDPAAILLSSRIIRAFIFSELFACQHLYFTLVPAVHFTVLQEGSFLLIFLLFVARFY